MTQARSSLISIDETPWYHCVNRCVRRAFLCGEDRFTGQNYDHRRGWIAERIKQLAGVFAIDVAGYAVMGNHYHAVLRIDRDRARRWSVDEVLDRWTKLFTGPLLVQRYLSAHRDQMGEGELAAVERMAEEYRTRLHDISWFMRTLNEYIARQANAEDGVRGRFWEGRFKSQALLDDQALLAAMAYVDLNPVRAGLADTPEASDYTSIQERLGQAPIQSEPDEPVRENAAERGPSAAGLKDDDLQDEAEVQPLPQAELMPFDATGRAPWAIPFAFDDYLRLVDWTGRVIRSDKRGSIAEGQPEVLQRLGIDGEAFILHAGKLLKAFGSAVGAPSAMAAVCAHRQTRFLRGIRVARVVFGKPE